MRDGMVDSEVSGTSSDPDTPGLGFRATAGSDAFKAMILERQLFGSRLATQGKWEEQKAEL